MVLHSNVQLLYTIQETWLRNEYLESSSFLYMYVNRHCPDWAVPTLSSMKKQSYKCMSECDLSNNDPQQLLHMPESIADMTNFMRLQYTVISLPFIYICTQYENHYYRKSDRQIHRQTIMMMNKGMTEKQLGILSRPIIP